MAAATPEDYYRCTIYIPLLDSIIADMTSRFSNKEKDVLGLSHLIPSLFLTATSASNTATTAALEAAVAHYTSFLNCTDPTMAVQVVRSEFENWKNYWSDIQHKYPDDLPSTAIDTYLQCDDKFYPRIKTLLKILSTLPVSVATTERSFSTLRILKTWIRAAMSEDRLTGLALLYIHRSVDISVDEIIDDFASSHKRKLAFVIE